MSSINEIRFDQEISLEQRCKESDVAIQAAMDLASRKAGKDLAPEALKNSGFAYGQELYAIQEVTQELDENSPIRSLSKQQQLVLTSQGQAWIATLTREAEQWIAEGRPRSAFTTAWAQAKIKNIKAEVSAERKRHAVPATTTSEVISTLKREKEALQSELEAAKELISLLQGAN